MGNSKEELDRLMELYDNQERVPTFEEMREMSNIIGSGGKTIIPVKALMQWREAGYALPDVNGVEEVGRA